jgi:hypothetical protein
MRAVSEPADGESQEVWTAEPKAQTVAPRAPTTLKAARMAGPKERAVQETAGERKAGSQAY